jgi:hypothetical protein
MLISNYERAFDDAMIMLDACYGLELKSALKQSASDNGIAYGEDMGKFVTWALNRLEQVW